MTLWIFAVCVLINMAKGEEASDDFLDEEVPDFYKELGVNRTATTKEIRKAFRKLAIIFHPDKNKEEGADEIFKSLNEANEVLNNEESRKNYDTELTKYEEWLEVNMVPDESIVEENELNDEDKFNPYGKIEPETLTQNKRLVLETQYNEIVSYFEDLMDLEDDDTFVSLILEDITEERMHMNSSPDRLQQFEQNQVFTRNLIDDEYESEFLQEWLETKDTYVSYRQMGEL
eukprot:GFUD01082565.1.p1 GENE.GFUD01082565.1~~GFUD01082565.1.p1  ORF type:complete len:231 (-),score=51.11 GFUD01082565.1:118-810(-)